jgi:hypothetical protein
MDKFFKDFTLNYSVKIIFMFIKKYLKIAKRERNEQFLPEIREI